ncbi:MAG: hypothetical protein HS115_11850 [Spirochaetales bacterium]|nr:hypothetical protein [Spirochaetales bacterium]
MTMPLKHIFCYAIGLLTSIFVATFLAISEIQSEFSIYSLSLWVLFPVGAILSGLAAALGYYISARFVHLLPNRLFLFVIVLNSAAIFLFINALQYLSYDFPPEIGFFEFLHTKIMGTSVRLIRGGIGGEVGAFGYIISLTEIIGFSLGGFAVYVSLVNKPYCRKCQKYIHQKGHQEHYFESAEERKLASDKITKLLSQGSLPLAISEHANMGRQLPLAKDQYSAKFELQACPQCSDHYFAFSQSNRLGSKWVSDAEEVTGIFSGLATLYGIKRSNSA